MAETRTGREKSSVETRLDQFWEHAASSVPKADGKVLRVVQWNFAQMGEKKILEKVRLYRNQEMTLSDFLVKFMETFHIDILITQEVYAVRTKTNLRGPHDFFSWSTAAARPLGDKYQVLRGHPIRVRRNKSKDIGTHEYAPILYNSQRVSCETIGGHWNMGKTRWVHWVFAQMKDSKNTSFFVGSAHLDPHNKRSSANELEIVLNKLEAGKGQRRKNKKMTPPRKNMFILGMDLNASWHTKGRGLQSHGKNAFSLRRKIQKYNLGKQKTKLHETIHLGNVSEFKGIFQQKGLPVFTKLTTQRPKDEFWRNKLKEKDANGKLKFGKEDRWRFSDFGLTKGKQSWVLDQLLWNFNENILEYIRGSKSVLPVQRLWNTSPAGNFKSEDDANLFWHTFRKVSDHLPVKADFKYK